MQQQSIGGAVPILDRGPVKTCENDHGRGVDGKNGQRHQAADPGQIDRLTGCSGKTVGSHHLYPMFPYIIAFGDSLTQGYGLPRHHSFASQLEALLRSTHSHARVDNEGASGDTTQSALARLPRVLSRLGDRPDLVIVELGANDLLRGMPLATTRRNLDAILTELGRCELPVLLARMDAPAWLGSLGRDCAALYDELGQVHGVPVAPFLPPGVLGHPGLTLPDRVHPNAEGYARIARAFLPAVENALRAGRTRAA